MNHAITGKPRGPTKHNFLKPLSPSLANFEMMLLSRLVDSQAHSTTKDFALDLVWTAGVQTPTVCGFHSMIRDVKDAMSHMDLIEQLHDVDGLIKATAQSMSSASADEWQMVCCVLDAKDSTVPSALMRKRTSGLLWCILKTRFVAKGYSQHVKPDAFAATPASTSLRSMLMMAIFAKWDITCCDISSAFANTPLPEREDIFFEPLVKFYGHHSATF